VVASIINANNVPLDFDSGVVGAKLLLMLFYGNNSNLSRKFVNYGRKKFITLSPGPCDGDLKRWYFNNERRTCVPFIYSGCAGNRLVQSHLGKKHPN
jgi:hypothetical protein